MGMKFLRWATSEKSPLMAMILCLKPNAEARVVSTCTSRSMDFYASAAAGKET